MRKEVTQCGSIGVWAAVAMLAFIVAVGLGVDFAGHARAEQEARNLAAEAARAGGNQIQITIGAPRPSAALALRAAQSYLDTAGLASSVQLRGTNLEVTVNAEYRCLFLGMIGVNTLPVTGNAVAQIEVVKP